MYSYRDTLKEDVMRWMYENRPEQEEDSWKKMDSDTVEEGCWVDDFVTGNASGSYTFSRIEARKNFFEDSESDDYVAQMIEEGFCTAEEIGQKMAESNWEWIDVSIRCFLLSGVIQEIYEMLIY